ncbi:MAG: globin [Planctomycetota bacterium]
MAVEIERIHERIGEAEIMAIARAFYARVAADPVLRPMYPGDDLSGAEQRLAAFLIYRLGGPRGYLEQRGHPRLGMRHAPFPIDEEARDRWLACMAAALDERRLPDDVDLALRRFFAGLAEFLRNR